MHQKPKIAVIGTRGPCTAGGIETVCSHLYPLLAEDFDITLYSRAPYVAPTVTEYQGLQVKHLPCPQHKQLEAFVHSLLATLHAMTNGADILHFHAQGPALFSVLPRLLTPWKKVVYTCHGLDRQRAKWGLLARTVLTLGEWASAFCTDQRSAVSQGLASYYENTYGVLTDAIPNGTPLPEAASASQPPAVLEQLGVQPGQYWLYMGRLVPEKAVHELLAGYRQLSAEQRRNSEGQTVKLVIAGSVNPEDPYYQQLAALAEGDDDIVFSGFVTGQDSKALYANALGAVTASHLEGFSVSLLEALANGLPVVLSDIPEHREVQTLSGQSETPFLHFFEKGSPAALAQQLQAVLALSAEARAQEGQAGQALVAKHFTWLPIARHYKRWFRFVSSKAAVQATHPQPA